MFIVVIGFGMKLNFFLAIDSIGLIGWAWYFVRDIVYFIYKNVMMILCLTELNDACSTELAYNFRYICPFQKCWW